MSDTLAARCPSCGGAFAVKTGGSAAALRLKCPACHTLQTMQLEPRSLVFGNEPEPEPLQQEPSAVVSGLIGGSDLFSDMSLAGAAPTGNESVEVLGESDLFAGDGPSVDDGGDSLEIIGESDLFPEPSIEAAGARPAPQPTEVLGASEIFADEMTAPSVAGPADSEATIDYGTRSGGGGEATIDYGTRSGRAGAVDFADGAGEDASTLDEPFTLATHDPDASVAYLEREYLGDSGAPAPSSRPSRGGRSAASVPSTGLPSGIPTLDFKTAEGTDVHPLLAMAHRANLLAWDQVEEVMASLAKTPERKVDSFLVANQLLSKRKVDALKALLSPERGLTGEAEVDADFFSFGKKDRHDIVFCKVVVERQILPLKKANLYLKASLGQKFTLGQVLMKNNVIDKDVYVDIEREAARILAGATRENRSTVLGSYTVVKEEDEVELIDRSQMETIGSYQILSEIARGGMGIVYKARQAGLNRIVALKVLLAGEGATKDLVARFLREAKASSKLRHPNIVPIYDIGEEGGNPYFTMEYVKGTPLSKLIKTSSLTPTGALEIMVKTSNAIAFAHATGIIHRDLKPSNIMIDPLGEPKVMDFGLAKELGDDSELTQSGMAMGTPAYMPPEQALGRRGEMDRRSDVYSLGAVLYQLLTGAAPFAGETPMTILKQVLEDDPVPIRQRNPAVHRDLEVICAKAMEKERDRRYQTADEFAEDLRNFMAGRTINAKPASLGYRFSRWISRNKGVAVVGFLAILFILVQGGILGYRYFQERARAEKLARDKIEAFERRQAAKPFFDRAKAYESNGFYSEALASYDRAIAADPTFDLAWFQKAVIYKLTGRLGEALGVLDEMVDHFGKEKKDYNALVERISVHAGLGEPDKAIADCDTLLERNRDDAEILLERGRLLVRTKKYGVALTDFDRLLQLNPRMAGGHHNRGAALQLVGRLPEALEAYRQAAALDPRLVIAREAEGDVLRRMRRYPEAEKAYTLVIDMTRSAARILARSGMSEKLPEEIKRHKWALYKRADCRERLSRSKEALADLEELLPVDRDFAPGLFLKAELLERTGRIEEAGRVLAGLHGALKLPIQRRALAKASIDVNAYRLLDGIVHHRLGAYQQAATRLSTLLKAYPGKASFWLGKNYLAQGRPDRAIEHLARAVESRKPPFPGLAHLYYGKCLVVQGKNAGAARHFHLAHLADPSLAESIMREGLALLALGRKREAEAKLGLMRGRARALEELLDEARKLLKKGDDREALFLAGEAIELDPGDRFARLYHAQALHRLYDKASAGRRTQLLERCIAALREAARLNPADHEIHYHLAGVLYTVKRAREALAPASRAIAVEKGRPRYYFLRGRIQYALAGTFESLEDLSATVAMEPGNAEALRLRGRIYFRIELFELAVADAARVLKANPKDVDALEIRALAHMRMAEIHGKTELYRRALSDLDRLVSLDPNAAHHFNRAQIKVRLKDYRGAVADFKEALRIDPAFPPGPRIKKVIARLEQMLARPGK